MELTEEAVNTLVNEHILGKIKEFVISHSIPETLLTPEPYNPALFFTIVRRGLYTQCPSVILTEIFPRWELFCKYLGPFLGDNIDKLYQIYCHTDMRRRIYLRIKNAGSGYVRIMDRELMAELNLSRDKLDLKFFLTSDNDTVFIAFLYLLRHGHMGFYDDARLFQLGKWDEYFAREIDRILN